MRELKLSIVDQSPAHNNKGQTQGLANTLTLAKRADQLGYHRYWLAEHHATPSFSCSAPEILIAQIAAITKNIRVGSGGVMLSHYSPYKVAEVFRTLAALHPNRIDLGIGRAPGGAALSSQALAYPDTPVSVEAYPDLVGALSHYLTDDIGEPYAENLTVTPSDSHLPQRWLLGSGANSINLAAQHGWGFVLALFIGTHPRPAEIISQFRKHYRQHHPDGEEPPPAMIANAVICADSKEEAQLLATSHTFWKVQSQMRGIREGIRPPEECMTLYPTLSVSEKAFFDATRNAMITGTADQCLSQLHQQAEQYAVDEIAIVAVTHDFNARLRSYELLSQHMTTPNTGSSEHSPPALNSSEQYRC